MSEQKAKKYYKGDEFDYYAVDEIKTPKGTEFVEKLIDTDEYVLARINYKGKYNRLAIRWHRCTENPKDMEKITKHQKCIGYPSIFGRPTWFVLPESLINDIKKLDK